MSASCWIIPSIATARGDDEDDDDGPGLPFRFALGGGGPGGGGGLRPLGDDTEEEGVEGGRSLTAVESDWCCCHCPSNLDRSKKPGFFDRLWTELEGGG